MMSVQLKDEGIERTVNKQFLSRSSRLPAFPKNREPANTELQTTLGFECVIIQGLFGLIQQCACCGEDAEDHVTGETWETIEVLLQDKADVVCCFETDLMGASAGFGDGGVGFPAGDEGSVEHDCSCAHDPVHVS